MDVNEKIKRKTKSKYDVVIIGAGIIGSTIAYYLSRYELDVLVIEKNPWVADETSAGNGGLIHGGFDASGKMESQLNVIGNNLWRKELLPKLSVAYKKLSSLVVAFNKNEMEHIHKLFRRGLKNGVLPKSLKILDKNEIQKIEPNVNKEVVGGLYCSTSIQFDPVTTCRALLSVAFKNDTTIQKNTEVTKINQKENFFILELNNKFQINCKYVINAAGHYADLVSRMAKQKNFELVARRGMYLILGRSEHNKVKNVLFMVPGIYGKGVTVAPLLDGRLLVGPTAKENIPKEDTRIITKQEWDEVSEIGKRLVPSLDMSRAEKLFAGSRPIFAKTNDFLIENSVSNNFINVAGTQSPALSSSPAIAKMIIKMLKKTELKMIKKISFFTKNEGVF